MQRNMASWDRWLRAVVGLALLVVALTWAAPLRWLALVVGIVFVGTAAVGYCPLYGACRISTAPQGGEGRRP